MYGTYRPKKIGLRNAAEPRRMMLTLLDELL